MEESFEVLVLRAVLELEAVLLCNLLVLVRLVSLVNQLVVSLVKEQLVPVVEVLGVGLELSR